MNTQPFDLKTIEPALRKFLFESPTLEDGLVVVLQNPQLLTNFVDNLFELLITDAQAGGKEELVQLYQGRHRLLQIIKRTLSKKDIALLFAVKKILLKKNILANHSLMFAGHKNLENFQEIMVKVLTWLKAPTLEQGISILQQYPELLTEEPIKMLGWLMDDAHNQDNEILVQVLRTLREFFQVVRLALIEKNRATLSKDEIKQAVKLALTQTDLSLFSDNHQLATFIA